MSALMKEEGETKTSGVLHASTVIETRQMQATTPEDNSFFPEKKKSCLGWDSNPRCSAL